MLLSKNPKTGKSVKNINLTGSKEEVLNAYLEFWKGPFSMSPKEKKMLKWFILKHKDLEQQGVPKHLVGKILLDTESRKELSEEIDTSLASIANYVNGMRRKNMIQGNNINPMFFPSKQVILNINIKE